jgi:hypothetical protein
MKEGHAFLLAGVSRTCIQLTSKSGRTCTVLLLAGVGAGHVPSLQVWVEGPALLL